MQQVFSIPKAFKKDFKYTFCPGCDHGIAIRLIGEVIDELGIREDIITSTSVGCSVFIYDFLDVDAVEAPHGRALASATGVKRARPDKVVFTYSGDGDFASLVIHNRSFRSWVLRGFYGVNLLVFVPTNGHPHSLFKSHTL